MNVKVNVVIITVRFLTGNERKIPAVKKRMVVSGLSKNMSYCITADYCNIFQNMLQIMYGSDCV